MTVLHLSKGHQLAILHVRLSRASSESAAPAVCIEMFISFIKFMRSRALENGGVQVSTTVSVDVAPLAAIDVTYSTLCR